MKMHQSIYIPKRAPPRCAAWSKKPHFSRSPAVSNIIIPFNAIPADIVKKGRNTIINCKSGLAIQQEDNIPRIAPDFSRIKTLIIEEFKQILKYSLLLKKNHF
jgi:hypothetical protein